ncbi:MAG: hypothetical protein LBV78_18430 [Kitasatospora sp.]|nr:hypothetical protein [Kitasatospora sp.]
MSHTGRCRRCGNPVAWHPRRNQHHIALHPTELPTAHVPESWRRHLSSGITHPHADGPGAASRTPPSTRPAPHHPTRAGAFTNCAANSPCSAATSSTPQPSPHRPRLPTPRRSPWSLPRYSRWSSCSWAATSPTTPSSASAAPNRAASTASTRC